MLSVIRMLDMSAAVLLAMAAASPKVPAAKESASQGQKVGQEELTLVARARALAPGELVRIVARAPEQLSDVEGEFDGEPLSFAPGGTLGDARLPAPRAAHKSFGKRQEWAAWAVLKLDRKPGAARVAVRARTETGRELRAEQSLHIVSKRFPEQRLQLEEKFVTPPREVQERIEREQRRLSAIYASRRADAPSLHRHFQRPVPGAASGVFGARRIFNGKPRAPHPGLDLKAASGTLVRASGPGLVVLADDLWFSGNTVILDHGGGLFTIYAHLSRIDTHEGETVDAGDRLGLSGATGRVTGPHLHWGAKVGEIPFDPTALLDPRLFERPDAD